MTAAGLHQILQLSEIHDVAPIRTRSADPHLHAAIIFVNSYSSIAELGLFRSENKHLPLVSVLSSDIWCQPSLAAGASSAVRESTTGAELAHVIESCISGHPLLPTDLAVEMIRLSRDPAPSADELRLIEGLAKGESMRSMALLMGYSERHLHRILKRLYALLNVQSRPEAIETARLRGWLSERPEQ